LGLKYAPIVGISTCCAQKDKLERVSRALLLTHNVLRTCHKQGRTNQCSIN